MTEKPKIKKGRGKSAMRIILHRKVHELHRKFIEEEGDKAKHLTKSYFVNKIADEMDYSPITVGRIINQKEE